MITIWMGGCPGSRIVVVVIVVGGATGGRPTLLLLLLLVKLEGVAAAGMGLVRNWQSTGGITMTAVGAIVACGGVVQEVVKKDGANMVGNAPISILLLLLLDGGHAGAGVLFFCVWVVHG